MEFELKIAAMAATVADPLVYPGLPKHLEDPEVEIPQPSNPETTTKLEKSRLPNGFRCYKRECVKLVGTDNLRIDCSGKVNVPVLHSLWLR